MDSPSITSIILSVSTISQKPTRSRELHSCSQQPRGPYQGPYIKRTWPSAANAAAFPFLILNEKSSKRLLSTRDRQHSENRRGDPPFHRRQPCRPRCTHLPRRTEPDRRCVQYHE